MNISVESLSAVDKKILVEADNSDLAPKIDSALRNYRKTLNLPGFRPGKAPMALVKKRIGKEVEGEQIEKFMQEVFEKEILPNHKPVGEPKVENFKFEDGNLSFEFHIGVSPEFDLIDINEITVDKLVHDVTDEEVEKEYEHFIKSSKEWKAVEKAADKNSKVTVDVTRLDADGNETDDKDHDLSFRMDNEDNKEYADALIGKNVGDTADIAITEDNETITYRAVVKAVEEEIEKELTEEFFMNASNKRAKNEEEFKSFLKSQIQDYFDQTSNNLVRDRIVMQLIEKHDFEVPKNIFTDFQNNMIEEAKNQEGQLPEDFNREEYLEKNHTQIVNQAKWSFLVTKLMDKYPDLEITKEDVDEFFEMEAAKMGLPADMLRNFYGSQTDQLENLRMRIRTEKLFKKLTDEVKTNDLSKEDYEKKYNKESK